jgi:hypothetical protein
MALDALSRAEQAKVRASVRRMQDPSADTLLSSKVARLPTSEPMYIMRAAPGIRVIFQKTDDTIDVLDVVRRDTLDTFARKTHLSSQPPEPEGDGPSEDRLFREGAQSNGTSKLLRPARDRPEQRPGST